MRSGILSSFLAGKQKNIEVRSPIIILGWWPKKKVRCGIWSLFLACDNHIIILGRWPKIKVRSRILSLLLAIFIFSFRYLRDVTYNSGSRLCGRGLECYHHIIKPRSLKNYDRIKKLWVCCTKKESEVRNHDVTTSNRSVRMVPYYQSTAYEGAEILYIYMMWICKALQVGFGGSTMM